MLAKEVDMKDMGITLSSSFPPPDLEPFERKLKHLIVTYEETYEELIFWKYEENLCWW